MRFSFFKKDPEKARKKEFDKKVIREGLPRLVGAWAEYQKLSRKERKTFKKVCEDLNFYVKLGSPGNNDDLDLDSLAENKEEVERLRVKAEREHKLVEEYLSKHPEVPEKIGNLILKYSRIGPEFMEAIGSD